MILAFDLPVDCMALRQQAEFQQRVSTRGRKYGKSFYQTKNSRN